MRCNVPYCTSDSKISNKSHGVSFHMFPKNPNIRKTWVQALGTTNWEPKEGNAICSKHFREVDFYETKHGLQRIHDGAIPVKIIDLDAPAAVKDLDAPAAVKVCRICLAVHTKMYNITEFGEVFGQITGISVDDSDARRLPRRICWECAARLTAAGSFRAKALLSDGLLYDLLQPGTYLKIRDVKSVNRNQYGLKTSLVQKVFDCEHYELKVQDTFVETVYHSSDVEGCDEDDNGEIADIHHDDDIKKEVTSNIYQNDDIVKDTVVISQSGDMETEDYEGLLDLQYDDSKTYIHYENIEVGDNDLGTTEIGRTEIDEGSRDGIISGEYTSSGQVATDTESNYDVIPDTEAEITDGDSDNEILGEFENVNFKDTEVVKTVPLKRTRRRHVPDDSDNFSNAQAKRRINYIPIDENLFEIIKLSYDQQAEEIEKRQESASYINASYKCTVCYRGFKNKDTYETHCARHSKQAGAYECFICKGRFKHGCKLRSHLTAQHAAEYNCRKCGFVTRHRVVAQGHMKFHEGIIYKCPQCPSKFKKHSSYFSHMRLYHMPSCVCELCGYTFVSSIGVQAHKARKHKFVDKTKILEGPYCEVCDVTFASQEAHDRHLKLSSKHVEDEDDPIRIRNEPVPVTKSDRSYTPHRRNQDGTRTRKHESNENRVQCELCDIKLRNFHHYVLHFERDHPGIIRAQYPPMKYPSMCEHCGKIFQCKMLLESHKWVHTGQKRYKCDQCNKSFSQKTTYIQHKRNHGGNPYKCKTCGKFFSNFPNMKRHMTIHTGLKPFKCDTCGKCFKTSGEVRSHSNHVHYKKPWPKKKTKKIKSNVTTEED